MQRNSRLTSEYYAINNRGQYVRTPTNKLQSPDPIKYLRPHSRCHEIMEINSNQNNSPKASSPTKDYFTKNINHKQENTPRNRENIQGSVKKGILKKTNDFCEDSKQTVYEELQRQKQRRRLIQSEYSRLLKQTIDSNKVKSQESQVSINSAKQGKGYRILTSATYTPNIKGIPTLHFQENSQKKQKWVSNEGSRVLIHKYSPFTTDRVHTEGQTIKRKIKIEHQDSFNQSQESEQKNRKSSTEKTASVSRRENRILSQIQFLKNKIQELTLDIRHKEQQNIKERLKLQVKQQQKTINMMELQNSRLKSLNDIIMANKKQPLFNIQMAILAGLFFIFVLLLVNDRTVICH